MGVNQGRVVLCPSCDLLVALPPKVKGRRELCPRCAQVLRPAYEPSLSDEAALAIAALLCLMIAVSEPFLAVESFSVRQEMSLTSIISVLRFDWSALLYIFLLLTFGLPCTLLCELIAVGLFRYRPGRFFCNVYTFCYRYTMVDVFILGVLVSLVKLTSLATVGFYEGFAAAAAFALLLLIITLRARPARLWELLKPSRTGDVPAGVTGASQGLKLCRHCGMVMRVSDGERCLRCGHPVVKRDRSGIQKAAALLSAAAILYLPSNLYPIMFTEYLGVDTGSNIVEGVISLWQMDSYFVALVILFASIFIPVLKILTLSWILWAVKFHKVNRALLTARVFRLVSFIGKWSMIDVFVVIIMSAVVRMSGLLVINPGFAIIAFCSVVLITMFAAESFDERLIWDEVQAQ